MRIFFILVSLIAFSAEASDYRLKKADCTDTDIRDHHPQLREHFSIPQDQGSIGWCYGFAASDLLTVHTGKPIAPSHVSTTYNKSIQDSKLWSLLYRGVGLLTSAQETYEGGLIGKAIKEGMSEGELCGLKSDDLGQRMDHAYEIRRLIELLERSKDKLREKPEEFDNVCSEITNSYHFLMPSYNLSLKSTEIVTQLLNGNINEELHKLVTSVCSDKVSVPKKSYTNYYKPSRVSSTPNRPDPAYSFRVKRLIKNINNKLNNGKPVGISYNLKYIAPFSGFHASTVIARRWNNGRCEYKVRNSWGRSCGSYLKEIECNRWEGSYWVKDETFYKMAVSFTAIDD